MKLIVVDMKKPPASNFSIISIYSHPDEELFTPDNLIKVRKLGCHEVLSLMFQDADPEKEDTDFPFTLDHAQQIKNFLDKIRDMDKEMMLLLHCDAGISRSGAVATFSSSYLDIDYRDEYIKPNPYILRTLNNLLWSEKWQKKRQ